MSKVEVDKNKCIGCGACTAIAPDVFEFDDDGLAKAVSNTVNDDVKTAAEGCPTEAITVEE